MIKWWIYSFSSIKITTVYFGFIINEYNFEIAINCVNVNCDS